MEYHARPFALGKLDAGTTARVILYGIFISIALFRKVEVFSKTRRTSSPAENIRQTALAEAVESAGN